MSQFDPAAEPIEPLQNPPFDHNGKAAEPLPHEPTVPGDLASLRAELEPGQCLLCRRVMRSGTTEHHLIPRTCHRNKWFQKRFSREQMRQTIPTCRDCHNAIHRFVPSEKELGRSFNTVEALMSHPDIGRFVDWVQHRR